MMVLGALILVSPLQRLFLPWLGLAVCPLASAAASLSPPPACGPAACQPPAAALLHCRAPSPVRHSSPSERLVRPLPSPPPAQLCIVVPFIIPVFLPLGVAFFWIRARYLATSREVKRWEATSRSPVFASFSAILKVGQATRAPPRSLAHKHARL